MSSQPVYGGKIAVKIPVIKRDGSSFHKKIFLGTLEAPKNGVGKNSSFICTNLLPLYQNVLNDDFDCGIKLHSSAESEEDNSCTSSANAGEGNSSSSNVTIVTNRFGSTTDYFKVSKYSPALPEHMELGENEMFVPWEVMKSLEGTVSKQTFFQRLLNLQETETVNFRELDQSVPFSPHTVSDNIIYMVKSMISRRQNKSSGNIKKHIVAISLKGKNNKALYIPKKMVEGNPVKVSSRDIETGSLSFFHFATYVDILCQQNLTVKDRFLGESEEKLKGLHWDEILLYCNEIKNLTGVDPFNGYIPKKWNFVKGNNCGNGRSQGALVMLDSYSTIPLKPFLHSIPVSDDLRQKYNLRYKWLKFNVTDQSMQSCNVSHEALFSALHQLFCYNYTSIRCDICDTTYESLFLTKENHRHTCRKDHNQPGARLPCSNAISPQMYLDSIKEGIKDMLTDEETKWTAELDSYRSDEELQKLCSRFTDKENPRYVSDIFTVNSKEVHRVLKWDLKEGLDLKTLLKVPENYNFDCPESYSLFTIFSCLDIDHIEYCINLTGGGRRKGDENDAEKFDKNSDSQQKQIDEFISMFSNLDLLKVVDIDQRLGFQVCEQYVLPEVEVWLRNYKGDEDNPILNGINDYRDRCNGNSPFERITVQELYVGLGKYLLRIY